MYSFSQFNEQSIIEEFFRGKPPGYFIDIGAASGVCLSNTFALALQGWSGLLIEPNPFHFSTLLANYNQMHGRVKLVNAAVFPKGGLTQFYYNNNWPSGIIPLTDRQYAGTYFVNAVAPQQLREVQERCDFLSIDTDGSDTVIFPEMVKVYPDVKLVCVEHINDPKIKAYLGSLFDSLGFKIVAQTPENYIVARDA